MRAGYQVGQVVIRDSIDHQTQWRDHLEQFRAARDVGFDTYCWAHHYLIDPFRHFQPFPVLARLSAEPGDMKLATSVLLLPLLNPVDVAEQVATLDQISEGRFILGLGLGYRPEECEAFGTPMSQRGGPSQRSLGLDAAAVDRGRGDAPWPLLPRQQCPAYSTPLPKTLPQDMAGGHERPCHT